MRNVIDTSAEPQLRRSADRRVLAIVLAAVGAACLLLAAFSKSWMANPRFSGLVRDSDGHPSDAGGRYWRFRGDIRFGPLGFEQCAAAPRGLDMDGAPPVPTCRTASTAEFNDEVGEAAYLDRDQYTSSVFPHAGWIAFGACLVSAAALLVSAALAFARVKKDLPISPASVALLGLMAAMAAGCVFVATKPGPPGMLGVDLGFWAFGGGAVLGILGAQLLAKELRPPDPDLLADALSPADFAAFPPATRDAASAPVPVPLAEVPPTQPVEALTDEAAGESAPAAAPGAAPADTSPGDDEKPA